ncbi:MAG: micrococcal nuclease [Solirubrobacterales bacterium]|nr:micrococcal nuclease [Solirubrobacterales bacterium]
MSFGPKLPSAGAVVLLIAGILLLFLTKGEGEDGGRGRQSEAAGKSVDATVVRVVDGDTAQMDLDTGGEEGVRFIGVDTPESVAPGQPVECFGKKASRFTTGLLEGERVTLRFGEERRDIYDRLLAYVYLEGEFLNAKLVRLGYARTLEIAPNVDYAEKFARLQQSAANAGRGLWGAC